MLKCRLFNGLLAAVLGIAVLTGAVPAPITSSNFAYADASDSRDRANRAAARDHAYSGGRGVRLDSRYFADRGAYRAAAIGALGGAAAGFANPMLGIAGAITGWFAGHAFHDLSGRGINSERASRFGNERG